MSPAPKSSVRSDPGVRVGEIIAGKYRVEAILGQGGMGVVVAAIHEHLDERVAIKVLRPECVSKPELAERFMREAKMAVKIKSPHVVRVSDVGVEESGRPYLIMEHLEGRDLSEELKEHGPFPEERAIAYVLEACDAIADAHAHGIVHRDLKPSNLFLASVEGEPTIKVLDFGISKIQDTGIFSNVSPSITAEAALLGSPYYMSPEQIRSAKDVDARTDVWSLGVILYELVTGQTPFGGTTASGVLAAICADAPLPIRVVRPEISSAFAAIVMQALEKDLSLRIQSVRDLVIALAALAPEKAGEVLARIERLGATTGGGLSKTKNASTRGSTLAWSPVPPNRFETSETVASFTQTGTPQRRRSILVLAVAIGLLAALGTFVVLWLRGNHPPTTAGEAASLGIPVVTTQPLPLPSAAPPEALPSASASNVASAPSLASAAPPLASTKAPMPPFSQTAKPRSSSQPPGILLGKEVETRR